GVPLLAQGRGLDWSGAPVTPPAARARAFLDRHRGLFGIDPSQLVESPGGPAPMAPDRYVLLFDRAVGGIPVQGEQVRFHVVGGRLVAFGATGWGAPPASLVPVLDTGGAIDGALAYMGRSPGDPALSIEPPELILTPAPDPGASGGGESLKLAWRVVVRVAGDPGTWVATIDAATGEVIGFEDGTMYDHLRGGVYPLTDDGACPLGCEQSFPLPYADLSNAVPLGNAGYFACVKGLSVGTALQGVYATIQDTCGPIDETSPCGAGLDLGSGGGTDCATPPGASPGDTAATRTIYYHLARVQEKARYWLPNLGWSEQSLPALANFPGVCNAYYNGSVVFLRSGIGCANSGEIGSIVVHEYAHGLDEHDGGGFDVPQEAYADVAALLQTRRSCIGEGFTPGVPCTGYGDACLECTGVREMDWEKRDSGQPATPAGFILPNCPAGTGACGRDIHCESYVPSEALFDLATRDLPAMGIDPETAWQLTERLWYASRADSGGDIFNCSLPASDGCGAGTWFTELRVADDDDGNLANGTPHAGAIFAAFDRHGIACGLATDPANTSGGSCPALQEPSLTARADPDQVDLSWTPVAGAAGYRVLRTEVSCDYSQNVIQDLPASATHFTDARMPQDLAFHYRVQARGVRAACDGPVSNCASAAPQPFAATMTLDRGIYACGSTVTVTVYDGNLGSEPALFLSGTEPAGESVPLFEETPLSARYVGTIGLTDAAPSGGDGLLSVADGDTVTVRYIDRDDGAGGRNVLHEASASVDCVAPAVTGVSVVSTGETSAIVRWQTPEPATSQVRWGEIAPGEHETQDASLVTSHAVTLAGLQRCTRYVFDVESRDRAGNVATAGMPVLLAFETPGDFGAGPMQCHAGVVALDQAVVGCTESLPVRLVDLDLNKDPAAAETAFVSVSSTTETTPETVLLTETGPDTATFTGSIPLGSGVPVTGDGILQAADGDLLTAAYHDADDGTGVSRTATATGRADCSHAGILGISVTPASDAEFFVIWTTAEPAEGLVQWGATPLLGNAVKAPGLATYHSAEIEPVDQCARIYFRLVSTDAHGNVAVADAGDAPLAFSGAIVPGAIFRDGFETDTGWTLEGEWEIGEPSGTGTAPDDPTGALFGDRVLGDDLSGLGSAPRLYESGVDESATSPVIDASHLGHAELRFYRYLNTGPSAAASVEVRSPGGWVEVWNQSNRSTSFWTRQVLDISPWADGNPELQVRFRQRSPLTGELRGGWNVDGLVVRDGSLPPFQPCGGCGAPPSMERALTATDPDPCAASGIQLSWKPAVSWGTGSAGSYAVYRGSWPDFQPGPSTLAASGLTATSWTDLSAPAGEYVWYLVRAENDESCGEGPANGGLTDGNLGYVRALDQASQPLPDAVGEGVEAADELNASVRLSWEAAPGAVAYHVYRAAAPRGPWLRIGTAADPIYEDAGACGSGTPAFYRVRAVDACGREGP
ncbi:MAG TPA: fibronectin type III domain-containing protein, partial [Candidatus Saccharimonadales bacterium]|nr:fibronectin type III domain-containing protein [Candidatus Saccharimonadales bacterium]